MSYCSAVHETTKFTPTILMFRRELRVPLDLLIGRPQEEPEDRGYPGYVERMRESVETIHNFVRVHQQEGSVKIKRWYDMRIVASTFGSGNLAWLHNPQRKKGISPKLRQPWKGPYIVVEWLNDVVYRIQRGHRKKPKVLVHKDRLWKYSGVQDKSEDVSNRTTTLQEHQEVNSKGRAFVPKGDRSYLSDSGRIPRTRRRVTGHRGSSRTSRASGDPAGSVEISLDAGTMK